MRINPSSSIHCVALEIKLSLVLVHTRQDTLSGSKLISALYEKAQPLPRLSGSAFIHVYVKFVRLSVYVSVAARFALSRTTYERVNRALGGRYRSFYTPRREQSIARFGMR